MKNAPYFLIAVVVLAAVGILFASELLLVPAEIRAAGFALLTLAAVSLPLAGLFWLLRRLIERRDHRATSKS